ncbi:Hint domain-containing protein [Methylobacterium sp. 17Sr1-1]|uniref:Hint domain-containing protein n=1 Tax=Methylobacterium sp. 17Sr1-1 TaxID=2202826 RepID=UPI000D700111|nr:Hint domain-containing protein [Methylobacterium sp. 17Sr1-1]AWN54434.1 hypothetical protein DK412_24745 [Methylobacterium sp. 17Sr1-1]
MQTFVKERLEPLPVSSSIQQNITISPYRSGGLQLPQSSLQSENVVTSLSSDASVAGSLGYVVAHAAPGATITFDPSLAGQTITLNQTLELRQDVTIQGHINQATGLPDITLSGGDQITVLHVASGATVSLDGLDIAHGHGQGRAGTADAPNGGAAAGGILNEGTLTVTHSVFEHDTATGGAGATPNVGVGGAGGDAAGAILNVGQLTVATTRFLDDTAVGGDGAAGTNYAGNPFAGTGPQAQGGGAGGSAAGAVLNEAGASLTLGAGNVTATGDTGTGGHGGQGGNGYSAVGNDVGGAGGDPDQAGQDGARVYGNNTHYGHGGDAGSGGGSSGEISSGAGGGGGGHSYASFGGAGAIISDPSAPCYCPGSLILTDRGEVAVEDLTIGDVVVTTSGDHRAIRWIGHRTLNCRNHPNPLAVLPVRISRDAFGPARPSQDLWVSPGHAICLDVDGEVFIPASALVNGAAVTQVAVDTVTYWHVELDSHDVLLANGLPAESYLDMGNRRFFAQEPVVDLAACPDADASARTHADFCRPFVGKGPLVDEVRARLRAKALENGWTLEQNSIAELHVEVGEQVIHPALDGAIARFRLPAACGDVRLRSLASTPSGVSDSRDGRRLGVDLKRLALCDGQGVWREIGLDDARLRRGFYPVEPLASGGLHRWTDGDALLPRSLWQGYEDGHEGEFTLLVEVAKRDLLRWNAPSAGTEAGHADEAAGAAPSLQAARSAA